MNWRKLAADLIAECPVLDAYLPADEVRRICGAGGLEPVIVDSQIAECVAGIHDSLEFWRSAAAELLSLPEQIEPRIEDMKRFGLQAFGADVVTDFADALGVKLANAVHVQHYVKALLTSSAALKAEYVAQGYDLELWTGLEGDLAKLAGAIEYFKRTHGFLTGMGNAGRPGVAL